MSKKKTKGVARCYLKQLTIEEGLEMIKGVTLNSPPFYLGGARVKRASDYQRFAVLSQGPLKCFECGCEGTHFMIERHKNEDYYHINPYAGDKLLTWDHIIPRSLGGSNHVHNGRVACEACNGKRGNEMTIAELLWTLRQDPNEMFKTKTPVKHLVFGSMKKFNSAIQSANISNGALKRA